MLKSIRYFSISAAMALCMGCDDSSSSSNTEDKAPVYVAVGNSLTAGFQSGGLRADWQMQSYPVLLAKQMGIEDFQIPSVDSPGLGSLKIAGHNTTPLFLDDSGNITAKLLDKDVPSLLSNATLQRAYNDLGVPGATTKDFLSAYDSNTSQAPGNGYFNVVLRPSLFNNATMLREAISLKPTLMTVWLGSNDILGGITAGTVIEGVTVTPTAFYGALMDKALDTLLAETSAHLFLINVPSITSIPFVTTVPRFVFDPKTFQVHPSNTPLLTKEANVQYVLLPALKALAGGTGVPTAFGGNGDSLSADLTLDSAEVATANALVAGYNAYLKGKADANPDRLTLIDVNTLLTKLTNGEITGLSSKFYLLDPAHSAFSLDGIHPNTMGYKAVANFFLATINAALGKNYAAIP
jgi:lysophospholipase L1-like esterase